MKYQKWMLKILMLSFSITFVVAEASAQACEPSPAGERLVLLRTDSGEELVHYFTTEEARNIALDLAELETCRSLNISLEHSLSNYELQLDSAQLALSESRTALEDMSNHNEELFRELVLVNQELRKPRRNFWLGFGIGTSVSLVLSTVVTTIVAM